MKTYIIYNEENPRSKNNALHCLDSFKKYSGWEPELFNGCWTSTLPDYIKKYNVLEGERTKFKGNDKKALHKYSCFYSHYALWHKCAAQGEAIAIVENDTVCVGDYTIDFDYKQKAMIQITVESMLDPKTGVPPHARSDNYLKYTLNGKGIHPIFFTHPHGKKFLAGNTGYIITPSAAEWVVEDCLKNGWTQNDIFIDTNIMDLYYVNPSPVKYVKSKELRSSSQG